jgi:hypothetical protein
VVAFDVISQDFKGGGSVLSTIFRCLDRRREGKTLLNEHDSNLLVKITLMCKCWQ